MKYLIVLNDPPYGSERTYNGLRLALALSKGEGAELQLFLLADSVSCAKATQKTPNGYYNLERMLKALLLSKVPVGACGSCLDARGLAEPELLTGVRRSSMEELAKWTARADKVIVF